MKILWTPHTAWANPQRAHLFCRALAERHDIHVSNWVADFATPRDYLSRRYLQTFRYARSRDGRVVIHQIPRISPALFVPALRRLNAAIFGRYVRQIIRSEGIEVMVGSFVVPPPEVRHLVFDLFDDNPSFWRIYGNRPDYAAEIAAVEAAYVRQADTVVAVSSVLADQANAQRHPPKASPAHLIPNGVDLARFRNGNGARIRRVLGLDGRLVIGLISALGAQTGLLRLIEAFALLRHPRVSLLVVGDGPQLTPARHQVAARRLQNVIFTGRVPFADVIDYYHALDIGVLPRDRNAFSHAACPIKLLEYSAAGKVVVSSDLTEVRRMAFPNVVFTNDTAVALADGLRAALDMQFSPPDQLATYDTPVLIQRFEALLAG